MVVLSLLLALVTLFFSDFRVTIDGDRDAIRMLTHGVTVYLVALLVAYLFLWFFGTTRGITFHVIVGQIIVLGVPAILGASAGRLLLSSINGNKHGRKGKANLLENIVFYLGVLILLSLPGYLILQIVSNHHLPPDIKVHAARQTEVTCQWKVMVENVGESTAEQIHVVMELYDDGKPIDRVAHVIDYLPLNSSRQLHVELQTDSGTCDSLVLVSGLTRFPDCRVAEYPN